LDRQQVPRRDNAALVFGRAGYRRRANGGWSALRSDREGRRAGLERAKRQCPGRWIQLPL